MSFGRPQVATAFAGLGDAPDPGAVVPVDPPESGTTASTEPSIFTGLGALALGSLGGALTGYVAAGDRRGALAGACVHATLLGFGATVISIGKLPAWKVITYGLVSAAAGGGAMYLFLQRKRSKR